MTFLPEDISSYCREKSADEPTVLKDLRTAIEQAHSNFQNMVDPITGQFLSFLVSLHQPQRILELGTFGGYSTLWMAQPFQGEKIITVDKSDELIDLAKAHWTQDGKQEVIEFVQGEADAVLDGFVQEGKTFDFFFIDANKKQYQRYFDQCLNLCASPNAVIVVDNVLGFKTCHLPQCDHKLARALDEFNAYVKNKSSVTAQILPLGDGVMIARQV